jgi:prepilin-type N-terminal cleavage/methylation domain-containing protein
MPRSSSSVVSSHGAATRGFTLIELLIAMSLGMVVLLTTLAGFRVTSQAVTTARRISIENNVMRVGVQRALEEVDFWTGYDDPESAAAQPLRQKDATTGAGLPFRAFQDDADPVTGGAFVDARPGMDEDPTAPRGGWNPNPLAWAAWDPRTWTRANMAEESSPQQYWGVFDIYDHLTPSKSWHHWYDGQVRGLVDAVGFYGVYEYLPSNAFLIYHGTTVPRGAPGSISWGGQPTALTDMNGSFIAPPDGGQNGMKGRIRNTNGSRIILPNPQAATAALCRKLSYVGYESRSGGYNPTLLSDFLGTSVVPIPGYDKVMPLRPAYWPDASFEVRRFIEHGHPVAACEVRCRSPLTGTYYVIPFTCVGTTLRGARQQRRPTTGWVVDPTTDATLDYAAPP